MHIRGNSSLGLLVIQDTNNNAHIVVEDSANVDNTLINSGVKLEVANGAKNDKPFSNVTIQPSEEDNEVILSGTFENINVSKKSKVKVNKGTKIKNKIKVSSTVDLNIEDGVEVGKVDIDIKDKDDKVILNGNLNNVNVSSDANIEIKSGNVKIAALDNAQVNLEVNKGAEVIAGKGNNNISKTGEGTIKQKTTLSNEAKIQAIAFDNIDIYYRKVNGVPAAIKVDYLLDNILVSDFAMVEIIDDEGKIVYDDEYVTESMKIRVTSEDEKNLKEYEIEFRRKEGSSYELEGFGYASSMYRNVFELDTNTDKGKFTGDIVFNRPKNDQDIDGYYLGIMGSKIEANEYIHRKYFESKLIKQVFVPKGTVVNGEYSVSFEDLDLKGYKKLNAAIKPIMNNKIIENYWTRLYDNPINETRPSTKGITIGDFTDTNDEKGEIEGTITFTKADNESNIEYYEVEIRKIYKKAESIYHVVGILESGDDENGIYTLEIDYPIDAGITEDIKIEVSAFNEDSLRNDYEEEVTKSIIDLPKDEQLEVNPPKLYSDLSEEYKLNITNTIEAAKVNLYKFDSESNEFIQYRKNGEKVYTTAWGDNAEFDKLDIGKYKVTQIVDGVETKMSNEAIIKPIKLSGILQNSTLSLVNAIDNATIKVYNEDGNTIKTITKSKGEVPVIENLETGLYYITQSIDGIESNKFVVPVNVDYTIDDISKSIIDSINKANVNAEMQGNNIILTKKEEGSIGNISIDTGTDLDLNIYDSTDVLWDKMYEEFGTYNFSGATALEMDIKSDFDALKAMGSGFSINISYNETEYIYDVQFGQEENSIYDVLNIEQTTNYQDNTLVITFNESLPEDVNVRAIYEDGSQIGKLQDFDGKILTVKDIKLEDGEKVFVEYENRNKTVMEMVYQK